MSRPTRIPILSRFNEVVQVDFCFLLRTHRAACVSIDCDPTIVLRSIAIRGPTSFFVEFFEFLFAFEVFGRMVVVTSFSAFCLEWWRTYWNLLYEFYYYYFFYFLGSLSWRFDYLCLCLHFQEMANLWFIFRAILFTGYGSNSNLGGGYGNFGGGFGGDMWNGGFPQFGMMQNGQMQRRGPPPIRIFERDVIDARLVSSEFKSRDEFQRISEEVDSEVITVVSNAIPGLRDKFRKERMFPCFIRASGIDERDIVVERSFGFTKCMDVGMEQGAWEWFLQRLIQLNDEVGVRPFRVGTKVAKEHAQKGAIDESDVKVVILFALRELGLALGGLQRNPNQMHANHIPTPDVVLGVAFSLGVGTAIVFFEVTFFQW